MKSAIYTGLVVHQRLRPRAHRLSYHVFSLLIDLDEFDLLRQMKLIGINAPGLLSFHEKDHGDGKDLRGWVAAKLSDAGLSADGPIRMLTYPRMFGYVFNPLTVYFCHDRDEALKAIVYEVSNTFGDSHAYVLPASGDGHDSVRHAADKEMYVSPFMPMECRYNFTIRPPGDKVQVLINEDDADGLLLTASFSGKRQELTDRSLMKAMLAHPLMTFKVVAGIHYEALKLFIKGVPFIPKGPNDGGNSVSRGPHHSGGNGKEQPAR